MRDYVVNPCANGNRLATSQTKEISKWALDDWDGAVLADRENRCQCLEHLLIYL